jgi:hypothetical protein
LGLAKTRRWRDGTDVTGCATAKKLSSAVAMMREGAVPLLEIARIQRLDDAAQMVARQ